VQAWREVRRLYPVDLVIAGRSRADAPRIAPEPGLRLPGEVSAEDLPRLYSGALALVYPSFYEGIRLPLLEATPYGTCVSAARDLAEVGGEWALSADTRADIARAMAQLAADPVLRDEYRARSLVRAREFSWERTARETREVYVRARRQFGG